VAQGVKRDWARRVLVRLAWQTGGICAEKGVAVVYVPGVLWYTHKGIVKFDL